jgi:hypothetical protein
MAERNEPSSKSGEPKAATPVAPTKGGVVAGDVRRRLLIGGMTSAIVLTLGVRGTYAQQTPSCAASIHTSIAHCH